MIAPRTDTPPGDDQRVRKARRLRYQLTSPNFSYRDHTGQSRRETGLTAEIIVDPEPIPAPEPKVTVDLQTAELPLGEWSTLARPRQQLR